MPATSLQRQKAATMTPQEALDLASALAAQQRARSRSARPVAFQRDGGFTRIGTLMTGLLAEAYAAAHGEPDADNGGTR